jgi:acylglycerol lipase
MRLLPLALAALLAGCAAPTMPLWPKADGPALKENVLVAEDGALLPLRRWLPQAEPLGVVLAIHGFNDYSNGFENLGTFLATRGLATYAYDQRGFGAAPERNYWVGTDRLLRDIATAERLLRARHPGVPLYCFGESMGGAEVMVALDREAVRCDGAILSAPAVWGRQVMPLVQRVGLDLAPAIAPGWVLTGAGLRVRASDNVPMLRGLAQDPLVIKGARLDTIAGVADLMTEAFDAAARLDGPLLWLYGDRDQIVPPRAVDPAQLRLPAPGRHRLTRYANGYHLLTRDLSAGVVLNDIAAWIVDQAAPLPSGADRRAEAVLLARTKETAGMAPTTVHFAAPLR